MKKSKDLNYALLIFTITMSILLYYVEFYPQDSLTEDNINVTENEQTENLGLN